MSNSLSLRNLELVRRHKHPAIQIWDDFICLQRRTWVVRTLIFKKAVHWCLRFWSKWFLLHYLQISCNWFDICLTRGNWTWVPISLPSLCAITQKSNSRRGFAFSHFTILQKKRSKESYYWCSFSWSKQIVPRWSVLSAWEVWVHQNLIIGN